MADDAALTMPPAYLGENSETEEQRRLRMAGTLRPRGVPTDLSPPALPGEPLTMPPAPIAPAQQSAKAPATPSVMPPAPLVSPQPRHSAPVAASVMPPAPIGAPPTQPPKPALSMPPAPVQAPQTPEPQLHGWRKYVDSIGSMFPIGRAIETAIPGTPQNWEEKQAQQAARTETGQRIAKGQQEIESSEAKAQFETPEKRRAYMQQHPDEFQGISDFEKNDFILQGKFPQGEGGLAGKTPEETTLHDLMAGDNGNPRVNLDTNKPYTYLEAYKQTKQAGEKPAAPAHFPPGEMVADPNAPGGYRQVGEKPDKEEKPGEYKPYTVPGSKTPVLASQKGDKLLTRDGKELPGGAVPFEKKPAGAYGEPGGDATLSGDAYLNSLEPGERAIVSQIGTGHAAPERIGYILARNPKLIAELGLAYPDVDTAKLAAYPEAYRKFTSGPESLAINAGNTALLHLNELQKLNTDKSRIPGTADYQKYQNKLDTISTELGRFYGNTTLEGIAGYRKTLGAMFNRDAAIRTQAQSMGDKLDAYENQWKNAAPSKAYEAPLPGISDAAKQARAELDPNYKPQGGEARAGSAKTYTNAEVQAAVAAHPGQTAAQIESAYKAKGYSKQ